MSQRDGFTGGFLAGAFVGGLVGGVLGAVLVNRSRRSPEESESQPFLEEGHPVRLNPEDGIEMARRSLEDKIAQLNLAIDDVRHQLGTVNENGVDR
jgi:Na+/glutamate symporter